MTNLLLALATIIQSDTTATQSHTIDEVVVVSSNLQGAKRSIKGQTASIDEHLSELDHVSLIRRGSYALEPVVNNMSSERLSTTIDGMKIFYACTDKMDPVTSYVESGNLQSISLNSGLNGNPQSTGNIGGSLNLKLRKAGFASSPAEKSWKSAVSLGNEFNGNLQVYGADGAYSSSRFYTNIGAYYRHAGNYKAGGNRYIDFSQFQKYNIFANLGYRLAEHDIVEGTIIYDRATNVGYPALNMDVAKAEGFITSLSYRHLYDNSFLSSWETKAYYNHIVHVMDDTKRPDVEIHMDMPGDSWTTGVYSLLRANSSSHDASLNYDAYYNRAFADMTMYPGGAAPMYMVTWPDVGTLNTGIAIADNIAIGSSHSVNVSAKISFQQQQLNNDEGYNALRVFFPGMKKSYSQTTGRIAASYSFRPKDWQLSLGAGWGSRAAIVTEAYGYYLNNTFDQYDYIGNPHLKNESAVELNAALKWNGITSLSLQLDANSFFFSNYIIGTFEQRLSPMTVDAEGVKVYANLNNAKIVNTSFAADWRITRQLKWSGKLSYAIGQDDRGDNLPLISPLAFSSAVNYTADSFGAEISVKGNARQENYGSKYGETQTPAYAIVNVNAQYNFNIENSLFTIRAGVENLFDKSYTTYSDWNNIPQKGRNIYVNLTVGL